MNKKQINTVIILLEIILVFIIAIFISLNWNNISAM